jgi:outer membrane protein assembly factor BamD
MPEIGEATTEETYALGAAAAAKGDHLLAIEAMNRVLTESPLNELADDALLALAESHRAIRDFASAEAEYARLSVDYPRSPLVPEASYRLGLAYYDQSLPAALDQTMTERAIAQFELFIADYPESPSVQAAREKIAELRSRLAEKIYESARLYIVLKDGASARVYFEAVARDYPDTPWAPRALLAQARSAAVDGLPDEARGAYERLIELYPESEEAKAAALEMSGS